MLSFGLHVIIQMLFVKSLLTCLILQQASAIIPRCNFVVDSGQSCVPAMVSTKYGFNIVSKTCKPFAYNGCGGNTNKFDTLDECIETCEASIKPTTYLKRYRRSENATQIKQFNSFHPRSVTLQTTTALPSTETLNAQACNAAFAVQLTKPLQICADGTSCPEGYICSGNSVCCPTKETVCSMLYDSGYEVLEFHHVGRYAFNSGINSCLRFSYFGASGNFNNFKTYRDCTQYCGS